MELEPTAEEEWAADVMYCARAGELGDLVQLLAQPRHPPIGSVLSDATSRTTPLHYAAANGHADCVSALLAAGARSTMNSSNNSPLHWAIANRQTAAALALLKDDPAVDVLAQNALGKSCSTLAFETSDMALIKAVLEHASAAPLEQAGEDDAAADADATQYGSLELGYLRDVAEATPLLTIREVGIRPTSLEQLAHGSLDDTGCTVWSASVVLARWLLSGATQFAGKSVMELGAGCGLPGLAAYWCIQQIDKPARVCLTDLTGTSFANLEHNAAATRRRGAKRKKPMPELSVRALDWTRRETWPADWLSSTDVLLGSDVVYDPALVGALCEACAALLRPGGVLLHVAASGNRAGMDAFVPAMVDYGFSVEYEATAPAAWKRNPLKDQDENMFALRFGDMMENDFVLREFKRRL